MLSKQDLDAAIAECLATDKPTKSTCVYLAAFQAVREQFFSEVCQSRTPLYTEALSENYKNSETKHLRLRVLFKYILKIG